MRAITLGVSSWWPNPSRTQPQIWLIAAFCFLSLPDGVVAQSVRMSDPPATLVQERLASFIAEGDYTLWVRDTLLAEDQTVGGNVLLLERTARIEGRIDGAIVVVDGDLFLRSGARVSGDVVVIGGGFYASESADVGGVVTYRPGEALRVRPSEGGFEIIRTQDYPDSFEAHGLLGLSMPEYNRALGLVIPVGATIRPSGVGGQPEFEGTLEYAPAPDRWHYGIRNTWSPSDRVRLGLSASKSAVSNEEWIHPTWYNSLRLLVAGADGRTHYGADRYGTTMTLSSPPAGPWEETPTWSLSFSVGREIPDSLPIRDVSVLFGGGDDRDDGPETGGTTGTIDERIDPGALWLSRIEFRWGTPQMDNQTEFRIGVEAARQDEIVDLAKHDYLLMDARFKRRKLLTRGHLVEAFVLLRLEAAGSLPGQRYTTLGGPGTYPLLPTRSLRWGSFMFADLGYAIPLLGDATFGGLDIFTRASLMAGEAADGTNYPQLYSALSAGLAVRVWKLQIEAGGVVGETGDGLGTGLYFDVRGHSSISAVNGAEDP